MFILYDLIFFLLLIFYFFPYYLIKNKFHENFSQKLGFFKNEEFKFDYEYAKYFTVWIHGVSVGEALLASRLAEKIKSKFPFLKIILSTTTPTGQNIVRDLNVAEKFIYFPLDLSFVVRRFMKRLSPRLIILVETELWPNLITLSYNLKIPIVIVNGRISDSSYKGYKFFKKIIVERLLKKINLFCMQSSTDVNRIISLGADKKKVKKTGNMKFDGITEKISNEKLLKIKDWIEYVKHGLIFVCGSTHFGEESVLIGVYSRILKENSNLKLILVPRHPHRCKNIAETVIKKGFQPYLFSEHKKKTTGKGNIIYIMDKIGWLKELYSISSISFVGGSLGRYGGHNIIEPAIFSKPIIIGSYINNFRTIAEQFLNNKAILQVKNKKELFDNCRRLINNKPFREEIGKKAFEVVIKNQGATEKVLQELSCFIEICQE